MTPYHKGMRENEANKRTSAFSFSDLSSSSTLRTKTAGLSRCLGCCSKPAYENVYENRSEAEGEIRAIMRKDLNNKVVNGESSPAIG